MKKLINYLFYLIILLCFIMAINKFINFSKTKYILEEQHGRAEIRSARMLEPVVKITHAKIYRQSPLEEGGYEAEMSQLSSATGFSVEYNPSENKSIIITNDHFCNSIGTDSLLIFENYELLPIDVSQEKSVDRVLITIPEVDLCLLELNGYVRPAEIEDRSYGPARFEEIFIVGAPAGDFPIIIDTYISASIPRSSIAIGGMSASGNNLLLVSEQIFPGHSGSPIYTREGKVIGVVFGALQTYGGLGVSHRDILDALELR